MTRLPMPEPLTLRQMRSFGVPLVIWAVATTLAAVAGPFGTFDVLSLWPRVLYWGSVAGVSVGFSVLVTRVSENLTGALWWGCWIGFVLINAAIVHLGNTLLFDAWQGWALYFSLVGNVGLVAVMVHGLIWALLRSRTPLEDDVSGALADEAEDQFLRKLPLDRRGPLIRIESQDHYLNVVTKAGEALILMRLSDAIDLLAEVDGLQVHRSHWVRKEAVKRHRKTGGRDVLVMADGCEVPVSRGQKKAAQAAGLM